MYLEGHCGINKTENFLIQKSFNLDTKYVDSGAAKKFTDNLSSFFKSEKSLIEGNTHKRVEKTTNWSNVEQN